MQEPATRFALGLAYAGRHLGRALDGNRTYTHPDLGHISVHMLLFQSYLGLETATTIGVAFGFGTVTVETATSVESTPGFGDLELSVAQELLALRSSRGDWFTLGLRGGLVVPAGSWTSEATISVTDVVAGPEGQLNPVTYNTQASLGGGTWASSFTLDARLGFGSIAAVGTEFTLQVPLAPTHDGFFWGPDVSVRVDLALALADSRLTVVGGADYRHHGKDRIRIEDEGASDRGYERVGGRDEIGAFLQAGFAFTPEFACRAGLRLPLWQDVGGVQLVESISGTVGCAFEQDL
jgi:hypothetical protein